MEVNEVPMGSTLWVYGIVEWEGWPDAIEHIRSEEIDDPILRELWEKASDAYAADSQPTNEVPNYLNENVKR